MRKNVLILTVVIALGLFIFGLIKWESVFNKSPDNQIAFKCQSQSKAVSSGERYVNSELGFSVVPTKGWLISVDCMKSSAEVWFEVPVQNDERNAILEQTTGEVHYQRFVIYVRVVDSPPSIQELLKDLKGGFTSDKTRFVMTKLDNVDGIQVTESPVGGIQDIHVPFDKRVYSLHHVEGFEATREEHPRYVKEFGDFLESFEFIKH